MTVDANEEIYQATLRILVSLKIEDEQALLADLRQVREDVESTNSLSEHLKLKQELNNKSIDDK